MASQKLTAGGEIVSYCTKCRLDLNHRIIALVDGIPVKVECESCGSHHKYRRPMESRTTEKRPRSTTSTRTKTSTPRTAAGRAASEAAEESLRERDWQSHIAGKMADEFIKYSPQGQYEEGVLVHHTKFGDGYVLRVIDAKKVEIMFRHESKVLAQGL